LTYPLAGWAGATFGLDATFLMLAGVAALGVVAAIGLWPANFEDDIAHSHPDL
jgi:predicted MFS family arabinose efflux permease